MRTRHVVCSEVGCPDLATFRGRCPNHQRRSPSSVATSTHAHKRRAAALKAKRLPCWLCGDPIAPDDFQADHATPVSEGGADGPLMPSHSWCNNARNFH